MHRKKKKKKENKKRDARSFKLFAFVLSLIYPKSINSLNI